MVGGDTEAWRGGPAPDRCATPQTSAAPQESGESRRDDSCRSPPRFCRCVGEETTALASSTVSALDAQTAKNAEGAHTKMVKKDK